MCGGGALNPPLPPQTRQEFGCRADASPFQQGVGCGGGGCGMPSVLDEGELCVERPAVVVLLKGCQTTSLG